MKVPNAERAVVDRSKLVDYLLNSAHPDNAGKAAFFQRLGFTLYNWPEMAKALQNVGRNFDASETLENKHGIKYVVGGMLNGVNGRIAPVRSIWIIDCGDSVPRLVTAYPDYD